MSHPAIIFASASFAQLGPGRAIQVPVWAAVLLLVGLVVVAYFLWKLLRDE